MEKYRDYLVNWLQEQLKNTKAKGFIVGVSGGIDSAVVANLIKLACPNNCLALIMPCYSSSNDVDDALLVCEEANIPYNIINLDKTYDELINNEIANKIDKTDSFVMSCANSKARLRMISLYAYAQNYGYLVVGTDNAAEWYTGYFTKYGDGGVDIAPLIHLPKSKVYELAKLLNVNDRIIKRAPSAALIEGQTDEKEMGFSYDLLEKYLAGERVDDDVIKRIEYLHRISEHKRNKIIFPKLSLEEVI